MGITEPNQIVGRVFVCDLNGIIQSPGCQEYVVDGVLIILVLEAYLIQDNKLPNEVLT